MTTYKLVAITVCCFLISTMIYGQIKYDKSVLLAQIKNEFQQINNYKKYKIVTIDEVEEFLGQSTDNGGSLTGYFKNDTLKKIIEWVGLSNKVIQNEYYLNKGKLVLVYSTKSRYRYDQSTNSFDYSKLDNIFKGRYYFVHDKLIESILSDNKHVDLKNEDFLTSSKNYLKLLTAKRK